MSDEYLSKHLRFLKEPKDIKYSFIGKDGQTYPDSASLAKADAEWYARQYPIIPEKVGIYDTKPPLSDKFFLGEKLDRLETSSGYDDLLRRIRSKYLGDQPQENNFNLLKIFLEKVTPPAVVMEQNSLTGKLQPHRAASDPAFQEAVQAALKDWEKRQKPDQDYKPSDEPVVLLEPKL